MVGWGEKRGCSLMENTVLLLTAYKVALDHTLEALERQPGPLPLALVAETLAQQIRLGLRLMDLVEDRQALLETLAS
jgi:hypothetical protein